MPATHHNYTPSDLDSVKRHLADILTVTPQEAADLARQHPNEVTKLAIIFASARDQLHQNWADALLAKVPLSVWEEPSEYAFRIVPTKSASMRFLSRDKPSGNESKLLECRRALHSNLLEHMDNPTRLTYRPMLGWQEVHAALSVAGDFQLAADTVFGDSVSAIERMLRDQVYVYEQNFRREYELPDTVATPMAAQLEASEMATQHIAAQIEQLCVTESDVSATVKESLLTLVSANISVNRVLLEYAAIDARGLEAAKMCIPFLLRLNYHGLLEVPQELDDSADGGASEILAMFTRMFAAGGQLAPVDDYFKRHMTVSDIEMIVSWSGQLQESYITSRGMGADWQHRGGRAEVEKMARAEHGLPGHRFIFALAMAAAFYENAQTPREFTGHSRPTYSVFPDRGDTAKGLRDNPSVHAEELLKQSYGQLYFSNEDGGWALIANKVMAYANMRSAKRSHIQQLLYFTVKNRSSRQLFALHQQLQLMRVVRAPN